MPGAAWYVSENGMIVSRGVLGHAEVEPLSRPLLDETPFDLASLTKPMVTAALLARSVIAGDIDEQAPVGESLEELRGSPWSSATASELAHHTSGLPAWEPFYLTADTLEGYLAQVGRLAPGGPCGDALYSDVGYILLGALLERTHGRPLDEQFRETIAVPLERTGLRFARRPATIEAAAATERGNEYERKLAAPLGREFPWRSGTIRGVVHDANAWRLGGVAGHAGLFGTLDDVHDWCVALLAGAPPFDVVVRDRLLAELPGSRHTPGFVLAAASGASRGVLDDSAPGHTGFTGTSLWLEPGRGRVYVLLTQRVHPEVDRRDFQEVRSEFHREASAARVPADQ